MQILPRLQIGEVPFDKIRRSVDTYLQRIVEANNHNAKEIEIDFATHVVPEATIPFSIPHVSRKIVSINASLKSGTCAIRIVNDASFILWKAAGGAAISLTTAVTTDIPTDVNDVVAGTRLEVQVLNPSSPVGLVLTLRTGS